MATQECSGRNQRKGKTFPERSFLFATKFDFSVTRTLLICSSTPLSVYFFCGDMNGMNHSGNRSISARRWSTSRNLRFVCLRDGYSFFSPFLFSNFWRDPQRSTTVRILTCFPRAGAPCPLNDAFCRFYTLRGKQN